MNQKRRIVATTTMLVVALVLAIAPIANAATLTNSWQAKIGTRGANGIATINAYTTGSGSIVLKLAKLNVRTSYGVVVSAGSCSAPGKTLVRLAAIKTSSTGAAARTTSLKAAQVTAIKRATAGTGRVSIRIMHGRSVKCGLFAARAVPPYVAATVAVGPSPSGVAIDPSGVWVTNWWDNTLSRINPATNAVLSVVPIDFTPSQGPEAIGSGAGSLWVTATDTDADGNSIPSVVKRIDPATGATVATIAVGAGPYDIDVSADAVWVANIDSGSVMRIDPASNQVVATVPIPGASGVTVGLGAVWVVGIDGKVTRIDPATNQIMTTIPTQATGADIATGNGAVWVTNPGNSGQPNGSLSRIDPATNQAVANTPLGSDPQELAVSGTNVWIGMHGEPTVVRVSATTNAVLNRVAVSFRVYAIAAGSNVVWAVHNLPVPQGGSAPPAGTVSRISAPSNAAPDASTPTPRPTATPTPTPTATPAPTPSGGNTLVLLPFFMLGIPPGWSQQPSAEPNVYLFRGPGDQAITAQSVPSNASLDEVGGQIIASIKGQSGADPEGTEAITMGGVPGRMLTYHFPNQGVNVHQLDAFCVRNGRAYELTFANVAGTESADRAAFQSVVASFEFLGAGF